MREKIKELEKAFTLEMKKLPNQDRGLYMIWLETKLIETHENHGRGVPIGFFVRAQKDSRMFGLTESLMFSVIKEQKTGESLKKIIKND